MLQTLLQTDEFSMRVCVWNADYFVSLSIASISSPLYIFLNNDHSLLLRTMSKFSINNHLVYFKHPMIHISDMNWQETY